VSELVAVRRSPQLLAASVCLGLAAANAVRVNGAIALVVAGLLGSAALGVAGPQRLLLVVGAPSRCSAGAGEAAASTRSIAVR